MALIKTYRVQFIDYFGIKQGEVIFTAATKKEAEQKAFTVKKTILKHHELCKTVIELIGKMESPGVDFRGRTSLNFIKLMISRFIDE